MVIILNGPIDGRQPIANACRCVWFLLVAQVLAKNETSEIETRCKLKWRTN